MQPGLELEEVQMTPRARQPVEHARRGGAAGRTGQQRIAAADLEIDASLDRVELDVLPDLRLLQPQRAGEQRFHSDTHRLLAPSHRTPLPSAIVSVGFHTKRRGAGMVRFFIRRTAGWAYGLKYRF